MTTKFSPINVWCKINLFHAEQKTNAKVTRAKRCVSGQYNRIEIDGWQNVKGKGVTFAFD